MCHFGKMRVFVSVLLRLKILILMTGGCYYRKSLVWRISISSIFIDNTGIISCSTSLSTPSDQEIRESYIVGITTSTMCVCTSELFPVTLGSTVPVEPEISKPAPIPGHAHVLGISVP